MTDIFAVTEAALRANVAKLDSISQNVANSSTQGYKREMYVGSAFDRQLVNAQAGVQAAHGAAHDWAAGPLRQTGSRTHFAIEGEGWFQLQSPQGVLLTRDGSFQIDGQGRLVSMQGWPVLMDVDARITSTDLALRANGELWIDGARAGQLSLAKADPSTLQVAGANLFRSTSVTPADASTVTVRQGFLEGSNVNALTEMVGLMQTMRQAEASQRAAHAYDEALEMAISTLGEF